MPPLLRQLLDQLVRGRLRIRRLADSAGMLPVLAANLAEIRAFRLVGFDQQLFPEPAFLPAPWCWAEFRSKKFREVGFLLGDEHGSMMTNVRIAAAAPFRSYGPYLVDLGDALAVRVAHAERQGLPADITESLAGVLAVVASPEVERREIPPDADLARRLARRSRVPVTLPLRDWTEIIAPRDAAAPLWSS